MRSLPATLCYDVKPAPSRFDGYAGERVSCALVSCAVPHGACGNAHLAVDAEKPAPTFSPRLQIIRDLLERDPRRGQRLAGQPAAFAVDHLRPGEGRELGQHAAGEHVAAGRPPVAQDAVVEQVVGDAVVDAEEGRCET